MRDALLGRPVTDRDWVVVGSSVDEMRRLGYQQVGRDFPVFLHPETNEEYALARTERKTGAGHTGFECDAGPQVSLADDLARRDLTINAMARDADDRLIDPFGGRADLDARVLRHVSQAFGEDPLRVFRVARFAAALPQFEVAQQTMAMMRSMASELATLSAERVWMEWEKAAASAAPARFFEIVAAADAQQPWFADVDLDKLAALITKVGIGEGIALAVVGWMVDAGIAGAFFERLKSPKRVRAAATGLARWGAVLADVEHAEAADVLAALQGIGMFRTGTTAEDVVDLAQGCSGRSLSDLRDLGLELAGLRVDASYEGEDYGIALRAARLKRLEQALTA